MEEKTSSLIVFYDNSHTPRYDLGVKEYYVRLNTVSEKVLANFQ